MGEIRRELTTPRKFFEKQVDEVRVVGIIKTVDSKGFLQQTNKKNT
jgi:hypothetical protein